MNIDKFKLENRYILGLSNENLEQLLNHQIITIDGFINLKGNYSNINNVIKRLLNKFPDDFFKNIAQKVYNKYNSNFNPQIIRETIARGCSIVFTSKKYYMKTESKISFQKWHEIERPYLLSIKESNIVEIFRKNDFATIGTTKNSTPYYKSIELLQNNNKRTNVIFIIKTNQHIICQNVIFSNNDTDMCINFPYDVEQKFNKYSSKDFKLPLYEFNLIDEIVDNNLSLNNLKVKIKNINNSDFLLSRIEHISNYMSPFIIPVGELLDMQNF